jgi:hypothetical protein
VHAGTTDVDVQVDLEIACGSVNMARLEQALRNAEFEPDEQRIWRWVTEDETPRMLVKFELLADLDDQPAGVTVAFDGCDRLGAANLRGTGFAARDVEVRQLKARIGGVEQRAEINVAGLAGFLLAKTAERVKGDEADSYADCMSASWLGSLIHATSGSFGGVGGRCRNLAGLVS